MNIHQNKYVDIFVKNIYSNALKLNIKYEETKLCIGYLIVDCNNTHTYLFIDILLEFNFRRLSLF